MENVLEFRLKKFIRKYKVFRLKYNEQQVILNFVHKLDNLLLEDKKGSEN